MRRHERGADPGHDFIRTIEIKNKEGHVVERKEVIAAKGLLHLAHRERLTTINTRVVQSPTKENGETAIVVVRVVTQRGEFTGLGDANPRNVNARIAPHFIRMAETRALARALRAALDIGALAIEELEDDLSFADGRADAPARPRDDSRERPRSNGHDRPADDRPRDDPRASHGQQPYGGGDAQMSDAQRKLLYRIAVERGHEGDNARLWLHKELGVESLKDVTKRAASAFIDRLLQSNGQNGQNGHAPS